LPYKSPLFPTEWDYIYDLTYNPNLHSWYYQESGVVYMNRKKHINTIDTIYELNNVYKQTYKYIYGDKETFWLSCIIKNKPFYMNTSPGVNVIVDTNQPYCRDNCVLMHLYDNSPFFSQKGYPLLK
jgi:hypothetical protein